MSYTGVKITYSIDDSYFKVGEAYQLRLDTNKFVIAIATKVTDKDVTFSYLENGKWAELNLSVSALRFNDYRITKMKPDYDTQIIP